MAKRTNLCLTGSARSEAMRINGFSTAALLLAGCGQQAPVTNETANVAERRPPAPPSIPANVALPEERTPLAEPKGPIDPRSAEAAGRVVQSYGALIEQKRFAQAEKLWGDPDGAAHFTRQLKRYPEVHVEIGKPGDTEGAAGSIYVNEPVVFYGRDASGKSFRLAAVVNLRRVNDVPGSTEAQRRWHISSINWKDSA
jgi:hypothetical protein